MILVFKVEKKFGKHSFLQPSFHDGIAATEPSTSHPIDVGAMEQDADDAEGGYEDMRPRFGKKNVSGKVYTHRNEHNKGEHVDLLVAALVVEEG